VLAGRRAVIALTQRRPVTNRLDSACEMPASNASSEEVRRILTTFKTVAVVGLSDNPDRDSHRVAAYLDLRSPAS